MILIYSDSCIIDREWLPLLDTRDQTEIVHDLEAFESATCDHKLAITAHRLHVEHDVDMEFEAKVRRLSKTAHLVFCLESELHQVHWTIWKKCHAPNVYWLLPGGVNDNNDIDSHVIFWGDWFKTTAHLYKKLPEKLSSLRPYDVKPKYFDALLGSPKPHREFMANSIIDHDLSDNIVLTYGGRWRDDRFYAQDYFIWEPDCQPLQPIIGTADWVEYCGHRAHLSQVMPIQVYNDCAYSIVAETDHNNTLSFFSEKTAKALIARRLFVVLSGYKFLANLRSIGFKTFGHVIDESYDDIKHDQQRYQAVFEQVKWLCQQDQSRVLAAIKDVTDHNHAIIMDRDWTIYAADGINDVIRSCWLYDH